MKKTLIILPYFGKFNNYFQLFLNSCGANPDFNFLIVTDDHDEYIYPENVKVVYMTLNELRVKVQSLFSEISVSLETPYKLCDYKPAYGYIFSEYIKGYDYWGHCDNDLIFGNIKKFVNYSKLEKYDKLGVLGHLTIYKNTKNNNELFKSNDRYKTVFSSEQIFQFDEEFGDSINNIFRENGKKIYQFVDIADLYVKTSNFKITNYQIKTNDYVTDKKARCFFIWDNGSLFRYEKSKKNLTKKEFLYIHIQKRRMIINNKNMNIYKIIPNAFDDLEKDFFEGKYSKIKCKHFNLHYFRFRFKCLIKRLRRK